MRSTHDHEDSVRYWLTDAYGWKVESLDGLMDWLTDGQSDYYKPPTSTMVGP